MVHVYSLTGITKRFTFENVNEEDLKKYFTELNFTSYDTTRILELWCNDKDSAKKEIATLEEKIHYELASEKWNIANNYYIYNQLYFSKDVSDKCDDLLKDMQKYLTTLGPKYPLTSETIKKQTEYKIEILPKKRLLVRSAMKNELEQK